MGFVCARILPGIGEWKKWSPAQIEKIQKQKKNEKPNPEYSTHIESSKKWTLPVVSSKGFFYIFQSFKKYWLTIFKTHKILPQAMKWYEKLGVEKFCYVQKKINQSNMYVGSKSFEFKYG